MKNKNVAVPQPQPILPAAPVVPSDLLTVQEVADRLRISVPTVYLNISSRVPNPLPVIRVGRAIRISWAAVSEWIARCNAVTVVEPTAAAPQA